MLHKYSMMTELMANDGSKNLIANTNQNFYIFLLERKIDVRPKCQQDALFFL